MKNTLIKRIYSQKTVGFPPNFLVSCIVMTVRQVIQKVSKNTFECRYLDRFWEWDLPCFFLMSHISPLESTSTLRYVSIKTMVILGKKRLHEVLKDDHFHKTSKAISCAIYGNSSLGEQANHSCDENL